MSIFKNNFVVGVTAALAATIIAPVLVPAIKRGARPLAKSLVRGGILLYERSREAVASAGEMVEDVVAEIQAEAMERQPAAAGGASATRNGVGEEFPTQAYRGNGAETASRPGNGASAQQLERGGPT